MKTERPYFAERPDKSTPDHVLPLLSDCMAQETPEEVLRSLLAYFVKAGALVEQNGSIEIPDHPLALVGYPPEAAQRLYRTLRDFTQHDGTPRVLLHLLRGSRASGSIGPVHVTTLRQKQDELDRALWNRGDHIKSFGPDAEEEGQVIVDYFLDRLRSEVPSAASRGLPNEFYRQDGSWIVAMEDNQRVLVDDKVFGLVFRSVSKPTAVAADEKASACTMTRLIRQFLQRRESQTHRMRSRCLSLTFPAVRWSTRS